MSAISHAARLCNELRRQGVGFELLIARDDALMVALAVPGERWEIEFFDDGHAEVERFVSQGVTESADVMAELFPLLQA